MGWQIGLRHRAQEVCPWAILSPGGVGAQRARGIHTRGLPNGQHWAPRSLQQRVMSLGEGARSFEGCRALPRCRAASSRPLPPPGQHTLVCLLSALLLYNPLTRFIGRSTNTSRG